MGRKSEKKSEGHLINGNLGDIIKMIVFLAAIIKCIVVLKAIIRPYGPHRESLGSFRLFWVMVIVCGGGNVSAGLLFRMVVIGSAV